MKTRMGATTTTTTDRKEDAQRVVLYVIHRLGKMRTSKITLDCFLYSY